jgi:hypothetical protein
MSSMWKSVTSLFDNVLLCTPNTSLKCWPVNEEVCGGNRSHLITKTCSCTLLEVIKVKIFWNLFVNPQTIKDVINKTEPPLTTDVSKQNNPTPYYVAIDKQRHLIVKKEECRSILSYL